jgi:hypothetical protein
MYVDLFIIEVPLILIRALNEQGNFMDPITEQLFDPRVSNEYTFEDQVIGMRILCGNLLAHLKSVCTVADLYPTAIGHHENLQRRITIQHTKFARVAGPSSGTRAELVCYKPKEVPLSSGNTCNMLEGNTVAVNVARVSSYDALNFHPAGKIGNKTVPALWELLQPKSSDKIHDGQPINPRSTAVLFPILHNEEHTLFMVGSIHC